MKRHVIEGTWTGYTSSQEHVVHRVVTTRPKFVEWVRDTYGITYTDGTKLLLTVRPCKPREHVKEIHAYDSLIDQCFREGVASVAELSS